MKAHYIPYNSLNIFSKLIEDYLKENKNLKPYISSFPSLDSINHFSKIKLKNYSRNNRSKLIEVLIKQYSKINSSKEVKNNLNLLTKKNSVTITTGHQLSLMTGPLYFIYKIVSVIKLSIQLNSKKTGNNYIPVFWLASEDHDFEEISSFYYKKKNISWRQSQKGAVGEITLEKLNCLRLFIDEELGVSESSKSIKKIIEESYLSSRTLSEATFKLVNCLFSNYGLIILDPNSKTLKEIMIPFFKNELFDQGCNKHVSIQIDKLGKDYDVNYKSQVNPREINLFYLKKGERKRIIKTKDGFKLSNSSKEFTSISMKKELFKHPQRFSPNVLMRPLFQEIILPNVSYIGGSAEISYWLELKTFFEYHKTPFPILLVRDSCLLVSSQISKKLQNLNISFNDLFKGKDFIEKNITVNRSKINMDLQFLKSKLESQFKYLEELVKKTDFSFSGAVKAQRAKQFKGIDKLEKRLLKAQKKIFENDIKNFMIIYNNLFPDEKLQERTENFFDYYDQIGDNFIPELIENFNPLNKSLTILEFK